MVINERDQPQAISHGFECRDIAMLVGTEGAPGLAMGQEPVEELVGRPEMEQRDRPWVAMDAARLHDAVVGVSTSFDFLKACQRLCIHKLKKRVKPCKSRGRAAYGLCIHTAKGRKRPNSSRVKDCAPSPSCVRTLLPESRASRVHDARHTFATLMLELG